MNRVASVISPVAVGFLLGSTFGLGGVFLLFCFVATIGAIVVAALGIETKRKMLEELSE